MWVWDEIAIRYDPSLSSKDEFDKWWEIKFPLLSDKVCEEIIDELISRCSDK